MWHTLVRSILLLASEAHARQPREVETVEQCQKRTLRQMERAPVHVSRECTQDVRRGLGVYTATSALQVRRLLWAKKWLREGTIPMDKRTGAGKTMRAMVFGRLSFEKGQAPYLRFVRQFLVNLDALREAVWNAGEDDTTFTGSRVSPCLLGIDLQHDTPSREQQWWKCSLTVPAKSIHVALVLDESGSG